MRKRLAIWLAGLAMVALPMTAMAMTSVSDSELAGVTGQAGVSINIDVTANVSIGTMAWGDSDGYGTSGAGYVGLSGLNFDVAMHPRTDIPLEKLQFINIDVAGGATPVVRIGLPTAEINVGTLTTDAFVSSSAAGAPSGIQNLGSIYIGGMNIRLGRLNTTGTVAVYDAGYVTIGSASGYDATGAVQAADATHSGGVRINLQPVIGEVTFGAMSWGNTMVAGVYGQNLSGIVNDITGTAPGFVGVRNLVVNDIAINGAIQISVGQSSLVNYATTNLKRDEFTNKFNATFGANAATAQALYLAGTLNGTVAFNPANVTDPAQVAFMGALGAGLPTAMQLAGAYVGLTLGPNATSLNKVKNAMVQILIEDGFRVSTGVITGDVMLSVNNTLTSVSPFETQTLGNFYIGGVAMTIHNNAARTQTLTHGAVAPATTTTYEIPAHPSVIQIVGH